MQLAALAQHERVGEALGGEERRARRPAGDDRVRRGGRPVDEELALAEQLREGEATLGGALRERLRDPAEDALGRRRRLAEGELPLLVDHHDVAERAAGVDGDAVRHPTHLSVAR